MGQRGTVEPRPQGNPPAAQGLSDLLAVPALDPKGQHAGLHRRAPGLECLYRWHGPQAIPHPADQFTLLGGDALHSSAAQKTQSLQQPGDPRDIVGTCLQAVGEKLRHSLALGFAACASLQQRRWVCSAQEQTGALRAIQPLVARHGNEGCPQGLKVHRNTSGGLRCIDNQRHLSLPAQGGNLLYRKNKAEHIGHVSTHRQVHSPGQLPAEGLQGGLLVKQRSSGHPQVHVQGVEGPGNGVVLIAGDHHPAARPGQGFYRDIQGVGGVEGKHHPLRVIHVEQPGGLLPAGKGGIRRSHGGPMAASARTGQVADGPGAGRGHLFRFL